jgi:hypothetical protein
MADVLLEEEVGNRGKSHCSTWVAVAHFLHSVGGEGARIGDGAVIIFGEIQGGRHKNTLSRGMA